MENLEKFKELVKGKKFFSEDLERKMAKLFENARIIENQAREVIILSENYVIVIILKDNTFDNTLMIEKIKYYERKEEGNELYNILKKSMEMGKRFQKQLNWKWKPIFKRILGLCPENFKKRRK